MCKKLLFSVMLLGLICHANGANVSIVQWGQPGGQTDIVPVRIDGATDTVGTTYNGTTVASPTDPAYYPSSASLGRTPVFYGAGTVSRRVEVREIAGGDENWIHAYVSPSNTYRGMLVWKAEDFLDSSDISRFEIEVRNRNSTDQGEIRWVVEKNSSWYISGVAGQFTTTGFTTISSNASDVTWYEFTPFVNGTETIGDVAQITMSGVTSVGYYWDTLNNYTANRWVGSIVRYFAAGGPPRALPFVGWAPRVQLPTRINSGEKTDFDNFDVEAFVDQLAGLDTASYVYLNLNHGAVGTYYLSSNPTLATEVNSDMFPTRDLLTEVLDEMDLVDGRPVIVYFATCGIKESSCPTGAWQNWVDYIASLGYTDHYVAVAELIIEYYSLKHGDQIDGWWFDGLEQKSADIQKKYIDCARKGNPNAIVTMPTDAGVPITSPSWADYAAGHPHQVTVYEPWDPINEQMVEDVEAGPWLDTAGDPVSNPNDGKLGHIFLPLQRTWNSGDPFPPIQAVDWTTRIVEVGGMFSWSLNRQGSLIGNVNFDTLLKINSAMTLPVAVASGENPPNETEDKAFDSNIYTKWLTKANTGWIAYDYTSTNAYVVTEYTITSANDGDSRDPKDWQFQGSNDGGLTWDTLDTQTNQDFTERYQTKAYEISNSTAYKVYRLNITANNGATYTQLAEIQLIE